MVKGKYLKLKKKIIEFLKKKKVCYLNEMARALRKDKRLINLVVHALASRKILDIDKKWVRIPYPAGEPGFVIVRLNKNWKYHWNKWYRINYDEIDLD